MAKVIEINPKSTQSDEDLVALLRMGDADAFEIIYKSHASDLFRFCRRNIASREDCEEIIQEVFVSLWQRHERLNITLLRPYLFTSVRYKIIRYISHRKIKLKYEEHYRLFEATHDGGEEENRTADAIQQRIDHLLTGLPIRCRMAFKLRFVENLTNGEIAQRMNISKKT